MSTLSSPSVPPTHNQRPPTKPEADKPCQWNYYGSCSCDKANLESFHAFHKCKVCAKDHPMLHCPKRRNPIRPPNSSLLPPPISSESDLSSLPATGTSIDNQQFVTPVIQHIIASQHGLPNAFGARIAVLTPLNIPAWESKLLDHHNCQIADFLRYGWLVNYTAKSTSYFHR